MSEDALKALLAEAEPALPPARDLHFVISVMERVERRRLFENLAWCLAIGLFGIALLAVVMPYITPALIQLGQDIVPAVAALAVLAMVGIGAWYLRPVLRDYGIPV